MFRYISNDNMISNDVKSFVKSPKVKLQMFSYKIDGIISFHKDKERFVNLTIHYMDY